MANLNGTRLSSKIGPAPLISTISSSDSLVESPALFPFSTTLLVSVSIAWEMRDFSRAANMVLASTPDPELPPGSPLLDPLSVEVSSVSFMFKSVLPEPSPAEFKSVSEITDNNRKIKSYIIA